MCVHLQNFLDKAYTNEGALQNATREGLQSQPCLPAASVDKLLRAFGQSERTREKYNTTAPLYSGFLVNTLNMRELWKQYALYLAALAGSAYMANNFFRAYNLAKYVKYKNSPTHHEEARRAAEMANAAPYKLERAARVAARMNSRHVSAAIAFPTFWLAWRLLSNTATKPSSKRSQG